MGRPEDQHIANLENTQAIVLSGIAATDDLRLFIRKLARRGLDPQFTQEALGLIAKVESGLEAARTLLAIERNQ